MKGKIRNWMLTSYVALGTKTLGKGGIKFTIDKVALMRGGGRRAAGREVGGCERGKDRRRKGQGKMKEEGGKGEEEKE